MTERETLAALTAQVRCDLEQHHPDCDVTDETISLVLELGGPRMKAAALREAAETLVRDCPMAWAFDEKPLPQTAEDAANQVIIGLRRRADRIEAGD